MRWIHIGLLSLGLFSNAAAEEYGSGLIFDDSGYQQTPQKVGLSRSLYDNLPSRASLKAYAPFPHHQGIFSTCVGWATAYTARTILAARARGLTDRKAITEQAFSPGFVYASLQPDDPYCERGSSISHALQLLRETGVPSYRSFAEDCPAGLPPKLQSQAAEHKIKDFSRLFNLNDSAELKVRVVKKALAEQRPVVIGMKNPPSFRKQRGLELWEPSEDPQTIRNGHALVVVGYDDQRHGGAFELQNSWGEGWGKDGYIWVRYDDFSRFTRQAYELKGAPPAATRQRLQGELRFVLADGGEMNARYDKGLYRMEQAYPGGTRFRIYLRNRAPAYVYVFGSDQTGAVFPLFPHADNISPALDYQDNEIALPDEAHYIETDATQGTDYLCVLYSDAPLDAAAFAQRLRAAHGDFAARVTQALGQRQLPSAQIRYAARRIAFNAEAESGAVAAVLVATEHR